MKHSLTERTLALAGMFQAAALVQQTAHHGRQDSSALEASIASVLKLDADDTADVYGGEQALNLGLHTLVSQLGGSGRRDLELTRYVVAMIVLERKLAKRPRHLEALADGVRGAADQAEFFSNTHANVIARLADLYQETISRIGPRILVPGDPSVLNNPDTASAIRALLLAGIRSAVLWRQCGGSRLQLMFRRRALVETAQTLLAASPD